MSEHGHHPGGEAIEPATALGKVANGIEHFIRPIYKWMAWGGALVLSALTVTMIWSAIGRYLDRPLEGATDIIEMSLLLMLTFAAGFEHMGHEKMTVDVLYKVLPKKSQAVLAPIIFTLVVAILCIAVFYMVKLGVKMQGRGEVTKGILHLPKYPFVFAISFGVFTLIPIYVSRVLHSIDRLVKR